MSVDGHPRTGFLATYGRRTVNSNTRFFYLSVVTPSKSSVSRSGRRLAAACGDDDDDDGRRRRRKKATMMNDDDDDDDNGNGNGAYHKTCRGNMIMIG